MLPRIRFKHLQFPKGCHSVLPRHSRHPPLCMSELSANNEGQARARGNCSSRFPPRCSTMAKEKETLCPEHLSFEPRQY